VTHDQTGLTAADDEGFDGLGCHGTFPPLFGSAAFQPPLSLLLLACGDRVASTSAHRIHATENPLQGELALSRISCIMKLMWADVHTFVDPNVLIG
jgi:hypothetical protein